MNGITFGNYHSYDDLHLILASKEIGAPTVKTMKIDVAGADGSLDLTDYFGEPKYGNVIHKFQFSTIGSRSEFLATFSAVKNALHGKKMRVILDDDSHFFYVGRLDVSSFTSSKGIGKINIEADCDPYKYKAAKTVVSRAVNGTDTIVLTNSRKRAVPEVVIEAESSLNIVYQVGNVWDLGSGSYTLPELELVEGENAVTVTGTGNITFTWQEAGL
jgi:hypothetical protein